MVTKFVIYIVMFLLACQGVRAEIIKDVVLLNQGRIDKTTIMLYSGIAIGEDLDKDATSLIIRNLYETEFFSSISVNMRDGILYFDLKENPIVNQIYLDGAKMLKYDMVKDDLSTKQRGVYTKNKIRADASRLQSVYQGIGYSSAFVEPKVVILPDNRVDIVFEIDEGEPVRIKNITIHGNSFFSDAKLQDVIPIQHKRKFNPFSQGDRYEQDKLDIAKENIIRMYKDKGFIDVDIENISVNIVRDAPHADISINIKEGARYLVNSVAVESHIERLKVVDKGFSQRVGKFYSSTSMIEDLRALEKEMYDRGFGYAYVTEELRNKADGKVDIVYVLRDDKVRMVRSVKIVGNTNTKDYIIRRELLLSEGSAFIQKDLQRSINRLRSLGYFKEIDIKKVESDNGKDVDLVVELKEEDRRGMVSLSAGYSNFEGKVLSLSFSVFNVQGKGYDVNAEVSRSSIIKSFNFGIHKSRFGDSKFGGGVDFGFSNFDARKYGINYISKSFYIAPTLSYRLGDNLFYSFTYSLRKDNMQNTPSADAKYARSLLLDQFKNITTSSITNSLFYDTRDNFVLPNVGDRIGGSQTIAGLGGNQKFVRHDFEITTYRPWFAKNAPFVFSLKGGNITGYGNEDVLFQNRYMVSYFNMRGFGYGGIGPRLVETRPDGSQYVDVISYRGNNYAIATFEQHFPIPFTKELNSRWYIFSDFATLYGVDGKAYTVNSLGNTEVIEQSKKIRNASGIGIAFASPFGVISIDYAMSIKKQKYDNVQALRISLGGMPLN